MHMKIHRLLLLSSMLLLSHVRVLAQDVGILHLTPLHLELPVTWTFDGSKQPIEGRGPQGEKVLISTMRKRSGAASEPLPTAKETARHFVQGPMGELASKGGKAVIRPVSEFTVSEGRAGYSTASEKSSMFGGKSYFIQYLLAAPGLVIYLTFEGNGEALPAMQRFDAFFNTQRWDE